MPAIEQADSGLCLRRSRPVAINRFLDPRMHDAARSWFSHDQHVRPPMAILWYGDGPDSASGKKRGYGTGVKPQAIGGRVFALQISSGTARGVPDRLHRAAPLANPECPRSRGYPLAGRRDLRGPVTMMMITAMILATGPSIELRICWSRSSHGIDEPEAVQAGAAIIMLKAAKDAVAARHRRTD